MNTLPKTPRLSVVIPVYKVEKYLPETIESIVSQDFDDYEAIFVDDGSPDSCPAILDSAVAKYPEKFRVIHLPENRGLCFARKTGVAAARGEFLTFLDGDDAFLPNAFSTMLSAMENNPADILRFGMAFQIMDENIRDDLHGIDVWFNRGFAPVFGSPNILKHIFLENRAAHNVCAAIYPTPLLQKAFSKMSDLHIVAGEDLYEMFILAHFAQSLRMHDAPLYNYRLGSGVSFVLTRKIIELRLTSAKNIDKSLQQFQAHPIVADFAKTFPQTLIKDVAKLCAQQWRTNVEKVFADSPNSELCRFGKECIYHLRPISRTEKVGRIVLFPLKKLRAIVWKIEKNPKGKTLLKPARFLWNYFYKTARKTYHFVQNIRKNL